MSEKATDHPVRVEFRTPAPVPVTALSALTAMAERAAAMVGARPLVVGDNFRQEGSDFVFSFTGRVAPVLQDDEEPIP
ncbi:hypothetical protein [Streptomyces similanensis]|uniref:Uncharacterized protein n=1 Tax=Streptomyces similanensis TaxID=1274988 RepID=A0ABP9L8I8_9ACTN